MRFMFVLLLISLTVLVLWPRKGDGSSGEVARSLGELLSALEATFRWYAAFDHAVNMQLWTAMSGRARAVLGMLKCVYLLLALWGLVALRGVRRVLRRVL